MNILNRRKLIKHSFRRCFSCQRWMDLHLWIVGCRSIPYVLYTKNYHRSYFFFVDPTIHEPRFYECEKCNIKQPLDPYAKDNVSTEQDALEDALF